MRARQKVLITGMLGFTGRFLRRELEDAGWEVYGVGTDVRCDDEHYLRADLCQRAEIFDAVDRIAPDAVIHLAGIAFVPHGAPADFYHVNLLGTRNLLEALARNGAGTQGVILASSANIYGNATEGLLSESSPPAPGNDYAVSKLAMEFMARLWLPQLPIIIARPFNYSGSGQDESFVLPKIVAHYRRKAAVIELGNLDVWRDFSDVRDVVRAYRLLLDRCRPGETINICSGRTHSLSEVLEMTHRLSGHSLRVEVNPAFVRPNEIPFLGGDPSRLRSVIGQWEPLPLEDTLAWMLENN